MKTKGKLTNKILILAVACFAAALCVLLLMINVLQKDGRRANVYMDGILVDTLDLDTNQKISTGTNVIEVKRGKIYMKSATCPDKLCVKQGEISHEGETVICLPNKVIIEIISEDQDIDALSQ